MKRLLFLLASSIALADSIAQTPMGFGIGFDLTQEANITTVLPGGPGEKAGLTKTDRLVAVNGRPVEGMRTDSLIAILKPLSGAAFTILREGSRQELRIEKAPAYTYDRGCLSGNCVNGAGKAVLHSFKGYVYEGTFKDGVLTGPGKVYFPGRKELYYEGALEANEPHGKGIVYELIGQRDGGEPIHRKAFEGTFRKAVLVEGAHYQGGSIMFEGTFDGQSRITSGKVRTRWQNSLGYLHCSRMSYSSEGFREYDGPVRVTEGRPDGLPLFEGTYKAAKREGLCKLYDRINNRRHEIPYSSGVPGVGTMYFISEPTRVAGKNMRYAADADQGVMDHITGGELLIGDAFVAVDGGKSGVGIDALLTQAREKSGQATTVAKAPVYAPPSSGGSNMQRERTAAPQPSTYSSSSSSMSSSSSSSSSSYDEARTNRLLKEAGDDLREIRSRLEYIRRESQYVATWRKRELWQGLQKTCNDAVAKYSGKLPDDIVEGFGEIRDDAKDRVEALKKAEEAEDYYRRYGVYPPSSSDDEEEE